MFINLSNHPSANWNDVQKREAKKYGEIVDLEFPDIHPEMGTDEVCILANKYFHICKSMLSTVKVDSAIHIAGEPTFCFYLTTQLLKAGYKVLTSTTDRIVTVENNKKISQFNFNRFREFSRKIAFKNDLDIKLSKCYCNEKAIFLVLISSFISLKIILDGINILFNEKNFSFTTWRVVCLLFVLFYIIFLIVGFQKKFYRVKATTMKKILGYTIGFKLISLCIALSFLCQITWLMDVVCPFFMGTFDKGVLTNCHSLYICAQLLVILIFMCVTFALFHPLEWLAQRNIISKGDRTLLVSGFSVGVSGDESFLTCFALDLFVKPFVSYSNINTVLILPSNKTFHSKFSTKDPTGFIDYKTVINNTQLLKKYNDAVSEQVNAIDTIASQSNVRNIFVEILQECIYNANHTYENKKVIFHFTDEVNYNVFKDMFEAIPAPLSKLENKDDKKTLINISPGTAMVSGALTTFAIKGSRQLIYCNQDKKSIEEATVDVWTLNELLKELWSELEESPKQ